jgi:hypothetical protein
VGCGLVDQVRTSTLQKTGLAAAAAAALIAVGMPLAFAAAPPSDGEGYVDSTARCTKPDTAVLFGTTKSSRVAICKTTTGAYEYRGVRVSDGAKLIASAKQTSDDNFVVNNDGVTYTVTPTALSVTAGGDTFRTETWSDFHSSPQAPASSTAASSTAPDSATSSSTATSSKPTTSGTAAPTTSKSATASASATSAAPLPPPMAAEVGGETSSGE